MKPGNSERQESEETAMYKIIRFRFRGNRRTIKTGLTLEQAQAHCNNPKTKGDGWFDGYEKM